MIPQYIASIIKIKLKYIYIKKKLKKKTSQYYCRNNREIKRK